MNSFNFQPTFPNILGKENMIFINIVLTISHGILPFIQPSFSKESRKKIQNS